MSGPPCRVSHARAWLLRIRRVWPFRIRRAWPLRIGVAWLVWIGLALPAAAHAAAPCEAFVSLSRQRAYVGQPVLHRTTILRPEGPTARWAQPRRFPGFRVERPESGISATWIERAGAAAVRVDERTWLVPVRAGTWTIPPARLRCAGREIPVPGLAFEALAPPAAGRPEDFRGAVGRVGIEARSAPRTVLGKSVRVHVTVRGAGDLAGVETRLRASPDDVEIFAHPPRITLPDGEAWRAIRHQAFDLVPRRAGPVRVEPLRISWFDPGEARYRVAESKAWTIAVAPRPSPPAGPEAPRAEGSAPSSEGSAGWLPWLAAVAAVCLVCAWLLRRDRPDLAPEARALRDAERAADPGARAAALERGLRAWLRARGLEPGSPPQLALERSPDTSTRECVEALDALLRARFGGAGEALDLDAVHAALVRALRDADDRDIQGGQRELR